MESSTGPIVVPQTEVTPLQIAQQATIAANFRDAVRPYIRNEVDGLELRKHQPGVFQELDTFFEDTAHEVNRSILMPLPPNAGKSTMAALSVKMAGVGSLTPDTKEPLRAITLVPRHVARVQTLETYAKLAPGIHTAPYDYKLGPEAFDNVDSLVLTYSGAHMMPVEHWIRLMRPRSMLTLDEVHRVLGPRLSKQVHIAREIAKPTTLALSATPEFSDLKSPREILDIRRSITPITPREATKMGISNGVVLYALHSGEELSFTSDGRGITKQDLRPLIDRPQRNKLILDTMQSMAEAGRNGIVQLVQNNNSLHARQIAEAASKRYFIDKSTGKKRYLNVQAVGSFQTRQENDTIIQWFREGKIDALTFTKALTEAFDCPLGYILSASPCGSEVDMNQFVGRGARLHDMLTLMFCIVDRYVSRYNKRLYTPFDVYEEHCVFQGIEISNQSEKRIRTGKKLIHIERKWQETKTPEQREAEKYFTKSMRDAIQAIPPGTVLERLMITQSDAPKPPPGYIPFAQLPAIREGVMTAEGARYALAQYTSRQDERPLLFKVEGAGRNSLYVLPEADAVLRQRKPSGDGTITRIEFNTFFTNHGWPRPNFEIFVKAYEAVSGKKYSSPVTKSVSISLAEAKDMLEHIINIPMVDPANEIAVSSIAKLLGHRSSSQLHRMIKKQNDYYDQHLRRRRNGLSHQPFREVEAISLEGAVALLTPYLKDRVVNGLGGHALAGVMIEGIQKEMQEEYRKRQTSIAIKAEHVAAFISAPLLAPSIQLASLVQSPAEASSTIIRPSKLLNLHVLNNDSYKLSGHGRDWQNYAQCRIENTDPDIFFSDNQKDLDQAENLCSVCKVKGDYLRSELENPSPAFAAELTAEERGQGREDEKELVEQTLQWLKESR